MHASLGELEWPARPAIGGEDATALVKHQEGLHQSVNDPLGLDVLAIDVAGIGTDRPLVCNRTFGIGIR
ncbi:hypothetical protein [Bradyrhizobium sp. DASA03120]|uniref:hypothetical protein n=1 Tax=Bradyrhizobium sp. SMVTL-02 TaxID=3395917 RepID=UPI003F72B96B